VATIISKAVVCDIGLTKCPTSDLEPIRVTRGGKSRLLVLCARHRAPVEKLWDQAKATTLVPEKGGVMEMEEIELLKRAQKQSRGKA
jgi:hypothetical protein